MFSLVAVQVEIDGAFREQIVLAVSTSEPFCDFLTWPDGDKKKKANFIEFVINPEEVAKRLPSNSVLSGQGCTSYNQSQQHLLQLLVGLKNYARVFIFIDKIQLMNRDGLGMALNAWGMAHWTPLW